MFLCNANYYVQKLVILFISDLREWEIYLKQKSADKWNAHRAMKTTRENVDRCDSDEDLRPPFHHGVPPASGRRSRLNVGVVSVEGRSPCWGWSAVERVVDSADCGGVHRSAGGTDARWNSSSCSTFIKSLSSSGRDESSSVSCGSWGARRRGTAATGWRGDCFLTLATRSDAVRWSITSSQHSQQHLYSTADDTSLYQLYKKTSV